VFSQEAKRVAGGRRSVNKNAFHTGQVEMFVMPLVRDCNLQVGVQVHVVVEESNTEVKLLCAVVRQCS